MTIGLVGYGRFGRLAAPLLARHGEVIVYDRENPRVQRHRRIRRGTLAQTASCPMVVLAVPVSALRRVLRAIRPHLRPDALVLDVCAVKQVTAVWMRQALPRTVRILGTHPFFGPDSAKNTLRGLTIVLCPVRISRREVRRACRQLKAAGLRVLVMTPREHDRLAASTVLLTQYVGTLLARAGLGQDPPLTPHYSRLGALVQVAHHDHPAVLLDMWRYNPFARGLDRAILAARKKVIRSAGVRGGERS